MNQIQGMKEDFSKAKVVYLTTFNEKGEKRIRPMTNYNEDPYEMMWFPTYEYTRKVEDIKKNPKVIVSFPGSLEGDMYEIEGKADFAPSSEVNEKWEWWYLYWYPTRQEMAIRTDEPFADRMIINVHPKKATIKKK